MALLTGDVLGKLAIVKQDLLHIRCSQLLDEEKSSKGTINALMPILYHILHRFSRHVASLASAHHITGRRGKRFIDGVFRFARENFSINPGMTTAQFMTEGFAERKLLFLHRLIVACEDYHKSTCRTQRLLSLKSRKKKSAHEHVLSPIGTEVPTTGRERRKNGDQGITHSRHERSEQANQKLPNCKTTFTSPCIIVGGLRGEEGVSKPTLSQATPPDRPRSLPQALHDEYGSVLRDTRPCKTPEIHQMQTAIRVEDWLLDLSHQVESLQRHLEGKVDALAQDNRMALSLLQTNIGAHVRVLERRVLGLEHRTAHNPTATVDHSTNIRQCTTHFAEFKEDTKHQTATTAPAGQQAWVKWNSPTACFNPLFARSSTHGRGFAVNEVDRWGSAQLSQVTTPSTDIPPSLNPLNPTSDGVVSVPNENGDDNEISHPFRAIHVEPLNETLTRNNVTELVRHLKNRLCQADGLLKDVRRALVV